MVADYGDFWVRFWGVRGSIPCPGPTTTKYGGNTSCIEVHCGDHLIILDGGTGMRPLGVHLAGAAPLEADLLYTHTHLDHVCGFPFFIPFFNPQNKFRLWAGHLIPDHTLRGVLEMMLPPPLFPVPLDIVQAELTFRDFPAGETLAPRPGVTLKTAPLNHPNNATGYRIEFGGRALCYITDTEHYAGRRDETIVELVEGADIVIYDATYTDEEYPNFKSWGHSTWQEGVRVADASNVKTLVIFHHEPSHDDVFMDKIGEEAEGMRPGTIVAREGMVLSL